MEEQYVDHWALEIGSASRLLRTTPSGFQVFLAIFPTALAGDAALATLMQPTTHEQPRVWIPLKPLSEYGGQYGPWAVNTCYPMNVPLEAKFSAIQFVHEAGRHAAEASLLHIMGPNTTLWVMVRPMQAVPVDGGHGLGIVEGNRRVMELLGNDDGLSRMVPADRETVERMVAFKVVMDGRPKGGPSSSRLSSSEDCSICYEKMAPGEVTGTMPCKHAFHATCIRRWLGRSGVCPLCRYTLPPPSR